MTINQISAYSNESKQIYVITHFIDNIPNKRIQVLHEDLFHKFINFIYYENGIKKYAIEEWLESPFRKEYENIDS